MTEENTKPVKSRKSIWRWLLFGAGTAGVLSLIVLLSVSIAFKFGFVDSYVKNSLVESFKDFGVRIEIEKIRTTFSPTTATLENIEFFDEQTGEKLAKVDRLKLDLTISNLLALREKRTINVNSSDLDGLEVWIRFDKSGNSNFSNLKFKADEDPNLKVSVASMNFSLKNALIHFGDENRKISGNAENLTISVEPEDLAIPADDRRYRFTLSSLKSNFVYDERPIEPIDIVATGIADRNGAEISSLTIKSPVAVSNLTGTIMDWKSPKYALKIISTVDLMQAGTLLPERTALRGFGNFEGTVTGEGETYKIDGEITSESLAAANIRLKGFQVNAKVAGEGAIYEGNGKAIAEMLTFEDFRIDFPQLIGNVRGSGTDFKWFGELQAIAARSPDGTLAGLFISDAVAEYKDNQFIATFGNLRADRFSSDDLIAESLRSSDVRVNSKDGVTTIDSPNVSARVVKTEDAELTGVQGKGLRIKDHGDKTDAVINNARAEDLRTRDLKLKNISADGITLNSQGGTADIQAKNVRADRAVGENINAEQLQAGNVVVRIRGGQTDAVSDNLKIAKIETDAANFGSLNIAGVRLKIVAGRIEGSSGDIDAGNIDLKKNGQIQDAKFYKPVFVLEPSGRYRASMDMSLGGGVLGSVTLGAARASVTADNDKVTLNNLTAEMIDGNVTGSAEIAMNQRGRSKVDVDFTTLDLAKILALQGGKIVPIAGQTTGKARLNFTGTNLKSASGTLTAGFSANAGSEERGLVPINGDLGLTATEGLFEIDYAKFNSEKSSLNADGRFDLNGDRSKLDLALVSSDAAEIERLVRVLGLLPELEQQLIENEIAFGGNLKFNGTMTGNLETPNLDGTASVASVAMRGRMLGSIAANILVSPNTIRLNNGLLQESGGGNIAFDLNVPQTGTNNISVQATLTRINTGNLLAALPIEKYLPEKVRDFKAETSGTVNLSGLPNEMVGTAELRSGSGTVAGQPFEGFEANLTFAGTLIDFKKFDARFADGFLKANGTYQRSTTAFAFDLEGKGLQASRFRPFVTDDPNFPEFSGTIDLRANATGRSDDFKTFDINFSGVGNNIKVYENPLGKVNFVGTTENQLFKADLTANLEDQQQVIITTINFGDENLPFRSETNFNKTELAPFIALFRRPGSVAIGGKATGTVFAEGNLYAKDADGNGYLTTGNIKGIANFSEFGLQFDETPIVATQPISITFNTREVIVNDARFAGAGSNLVVNGTKALNDSGINNFTIDGKINLRFLNLASKNTFYSGLADISIRLTGVNKQSRLSGSASVENASISAFVGSERLNFERIQGRVIFTSNQAQIERAVGYLGGGKVVGSGGALVEGLKLQQARLELRGQNITAPLPKNFLTTGDAEVEISTKREGEKYNTLIAGTIFAKRSVYTKDIDLADFISSRRDASISEGTTPALLGIPRLDLRLQGRDALVVRNNLADLTASIDLRVTGDVDYPVISGRVTANSGLVFFRNDRYNVNRGTVEFPPQSDNEPFVNLQAESDIKGYQVFVNLVGELSNLDALTATVRSNPALPQADVISLITTGNLSNNESGIPTYAQSGLNTAAEVITDSLINNPVRKATDKLFGLNKFEIDPILSGRRLNPTARLTVGRQVNKDLAITYSTNLSEDQNQILAVEYRLSNRLSFVAQYEQRSLSNVTRNNNVFSFEVRLRKRF